ncbi:ParE-like toxin of type II ParDE toxin-antitoxin system [Muricomes intestini]|jgi:plasmid stabilization system protein ParE|uniref:ParE-like toxin of type II ParDE toxin-antitoxin system n=1 Tax=Muricomes intestini TaxID=1796634 RepID=A0A4R3KGE2_9FIRM|nr:ParE-like toxin of type II ParDE toxin-antitoxin system [Muricomes intestini]
MKLRINSLVAADLKAIKDYIAEDNAEAARKTVDEIYKTFQKLTAVSNDGSRFIKESEF